MSSVYYFQKIVYLSLYCKIITMMTNIISGVSGKLETVKMFFTHIKQS